MTRIGRALDRTVVVFGLVCAMFVVAISSRVAIGTSKRRTDCRRTDMVAVIALVFIVSFSSVQLFDSLRLTVSNTKFPGANSMSTSQSSYHNTDAF